MFFRYVGGLRIAVDLDGLFGGSVFLVGGHPSVKEHLPKLEARGLSTMAMNNTGTVFRPTLWVGADKPDHYSPSIYHDPTIMKFAMVSRASIIADGRPWHRFPNMWFVVGIDQKARDLFLPGRDFAWWKNVFTMALQILHRLGFSRVYCVGSKFCISQEEQYSYESNLNPEQVRYNQRTYDMVISWMRQILPHAHRSHFEIISCTPGSKLNGFVQYMDLDEAIAREKALLPAHRTKDCTHPRPASLPPEVTAQTKLPSCSVLIPTYNRDELLDLGLQSLRRVEYGGDLEVIVLDEGSGQAATREIAQRWNALYVHTKNASGWRIPGFAFNIGAKIARGEILVLTCPEIWHMNGCLEKLARAVQADPKVMAIPAGWDDDGTYLKLVQGAETALDSQHLKLPSLRTELPFLMALRKQVYLEIGGYDEDFLGRSYDDDDIADRLQRHGLRYVKTDAECVHLWHERQTLKKTRDDDRVALNRRLFLERRGQVVRNVGREWGVLKS